MCTVLLTTGVNPIAVKFIHHIVFLVLQEWGFCGWAGNPSKENKVLISNDAQPWIVDAPENDGNASMPEEVKRPNPWRKMMTMMITESRRREISYKK
jgi:hypothetical protein